MTGADHFKGLGSEMMIGRGNKFEWFWIEVRGATRKVESAPISDHTYLTNICNGLTIELGEAELLFS
jgi:hypothetical protein